MAKKLMSVADAKKALTDAGLDPSIFQNIDWTKVIAIIQAIIAMFGSKKKAATADGETCGPEDQMDHIKCHFEAIRELAQCGCDCCDECSGG